MPIPSFLILVEPSRFGFNEETAVNNHFQKNTKLDEAQLQAMKEFRSLINTLEENHVAHKVFPNRENQNTPDAVFPNNWFAVLPGGELFVFPMYAPNRRAERNESILQFLHEHFKISCTNDLSTYENESRFLEGTGSIVFDHQAKVAYACISERTDEKLLNQLCHEIHYQPYTFSATDLQGKPVYHTNVVMNIGSDYAIVCLSSIEDTLERHMLKQTLEHSGKEVIEISLPQMNAFCGNMLEVKNTHGEHLLLMSQTAFENLNNEQKLQLQKRVRLIHIPIPAIETIGGGSLRCMLAGIHAPAK